ncbi:hypothetical protein D3C75_1247560 [compost metagenome]
MRRVSQLGGSIDGFTRTTSCPASADAGSDALADNPAKSYSSCDSSSQCSFASTSFSSTSTIARSHLEALSPAAFS